MLSYPFILTVALILTLIDWFRHSMTILIVNASTREETRKQLDDTLAQQKEIIDKKLRNTEYPHI